MMLQSVNDLHTPSSRDDKNKQHEQSQIQYGGRGVEAEEYD